ncbi:MAG TPA: gephyrin-like molybdotransferase Glp [Streptosporangiaceae bacterium]|nr:gephyrin-like molybdotransferase Glp [Streptosporangiaceae bacterium]
MALRTVDEHLAEILAAVMPVPPLEVAVPEARGAVLAETVTAPVSLPPFDNSAMDGYAVVAADVAAASAETPVTLPVIGDIAAGEPGVEAIRPGMCARIMTGAPMPAGADAVVPVEWTDGGTATVRISRSAPPGHYIRRSGEDVKAGQEVLPAGTLLGAAQVGMLAAVGRAQVAVRPRPRVVVLSTGSELREPGSPLGPGEIWDSNSYMLAAAAAEAGALGYREATLADEPAKVIEAIEDQVTRADAIVTSGGVSMGARDVVKEVLTGRVTFTKVAMRPGKPQGFGVLREQTPIFTLPGNPVSAYVSFQVFVRPALRALQGLPPEPPALVTAALTEAVTSPPGLRHFMRATLRFDAGHYSVAPAESQGSHQLAALAAANALIVVPEEVESLPAGAQVEVMRLP